MLDAGHERSALRPHRGHPAKADAGDRRTVIGVFTRDDDVASGLALHFPVMAHEPDDGVVRFRSGIVEEDVLEIAAEKLRDLRRQHDGRRHRRLEEGVVVGKLDHLPMRGVREFLAPISDLHAPEARHAVEYGLPFRVPNVASLPARDDPASAYVAHHAIILLPGQMVGYIQSAQFGEVVVSTCHFFPET